MNERIKELAEQATVKASNDTYGWVMEFDKEKFAELLIKECVQYLKETDYSEYDKANDALEAAGDDLKTLFGVE